MVKRERRLRINKRREPPLGLPLQSGELRICSYVRKITTSGREAMGCVATVGKRLRRMKRLHL